MAVDWISEIASIAHRLWCEEMLRTGWKTGPYNPEAQTHDALVPYGELPRRDRRRLEVAVQSEDIPGQLVELCDHYRGSNIEFELDEMRVGLPVILAPDEGGCEELEVAGAAEVGFVESWDVDPGSGELNVVRVRWPDGTRAEYGVGERLLRRAK